MTANLSPIEYHPATPADLAAMADMRKLMEPNKGKMRGIAARVGYDAIMTRVAAPSGVTFRSDIVGGVPGWWCDPENARQNAAILHVHGGWFNWGSAEAFRHLVGHIAQSAGTSAFVPDYRLAPEHKYPAPLEDLTACYEGLCDLGATSIVITGDSAGGNLALLMLKLARSEYLTRLAFLGAVVLSPVTDLALTGASWESRADADPFFVRDQAQELVQAYLGYADPLDPAISPLFANATGLPPIRIHVGDAEVLLDDSVRYGEKASAAGVDIKVDVWEGMPHGFLGSIGRLNAASGALAGIGAFLVACFDRGKAN